MTREIDESAGIDPVQTLQQAAGLARHLERSGVQFLPAAREEAVAALKEQLVASEDPAAAEVGSIAGGPAASQPAVHTGDPPSDQSPAGSDGKTTSTARQTVETVSAPAGDFQLAGASGGQSYPGPSLPLEQRSELLEQWAQKVSACTRCEVLSKCRTKTVFGEGSAQPRVVFFGEGPGRDEDLSGRPFVGKAGQLLTKMIQACQFAREDVYIMNTVKCRPPNNRNPEPTEVENCREYFETQLQVLRPEYIVCLGLVSAQALLKTKLSVGRMRGKFHKHYDSKVLVTYHPSYLLRTPAAKKAAWEDLQMMLRDAGLL